MTSLRQDFKAARGVLFDLDLTVADTLAAHLATAREIFTAKRQLLKPEWEKELFVDDLSDETLRRLYFNPSGDEVLEYFNGNTSREDLRDDVGMIFRSFRHLITVYDAFFQILDLCRELKKQTGIITNADRREASAVLAVARESSWCMAYNLEETLRRMPVVATENMPPKPNPAPLRAFRTQYPRIRLEPVSLYVGDEWSDMVFARNTGLVGVYIDRNFGCKPGPSVTQVYQRYHRVVSLDEFFKAVSE